MTLHPPAYTILGSRGMLGRAWRELLDSQGTHHRDLDRSPRSSNAGFQDSSPSLDLTDPASIARSIPAGTRVVVNCAAYTNVDACEADEAAATAVNAAGVGHLARHCAAIGATLIHYSTDYVFAGDAASPYPVDAPIAPVSAYGRSKAAGERAVRDSGCDHRLIRTSWLYAPWGKNFVLTMLKLTAEKDTLKVVDDQRGRPTSATHLAAVSLQLLDQAPSGTYHVADGGQCTWHEFAVEIARQAGHDCDIRPCTTAEFPRPAPRPAYSVLDLSVTERHVGAMPDWKTNLAAVIRATQPI